MCRPPRDFLLATASCLLFLGLGTRDPGWVLSTFYDALRAHRLFLVGGNGGDVAFLQRTQVSVRKRWVGLVPGEAFEISLKPGFFRENFAPPSVDFLSHLGGVLDK